MPSPTNKGIEISAMLRLGRPVFDVLRSNVGVAVLDQVPGAHADHEEAWGWGKPTVSVSLEVHRQRQHTEHDPQRAGSSRSSWITQPSCR